MIRKDDAGCSMEVQEVSQVEIVGNVEIAGVDVAQSETVGKVWLWKWGCLGGIDY